MLPLPVGVYIYSKALKPVSALLSNPRNRATCPKWSTPQNPSFSPFSFVHENHGNPNAPSAMAASVFLFRSALIAGVDDYCS